MTSDITYETNALKWLQGLRFAAAMACYCDDCISSLDYIGWTIWWNWLSQNISAYHWLGSLKGNYIISHGTKSILHGEYNLIGNAIE